MMSSSTSSLLATLLTCGEFTIRPLTSQDDAGIAAVIRQVSAEHGLTAENGFSVGDSTLDRLSLVYSRPQSMYWVIEHQGEIVGGGGFAPVVGEPVVCELQKMYLLPETRGHGLARHLYTLVEAHAKAMGYTACYLETTPALSTAIALYGKLGFVRIQHPIGATGHHGCDVLMLKPFQ